MENEGLRCDKCKWWNEPRDDGMDEGNMQGTCKRFPPFFTVGNADYDDRFSGYAHPVTISDDFCGEFTPRKGCPGGPNEKERDSRLLEELLWVYSRSQSGIERGFATRARTVCRRASIVTVDDLAGMRSEDWDFARNHGPVLHNWLTRWAMKHCGVKVSPILR